MDHVIISINREYGSGGLEIGGKLSERLGIAVHNADIVRVAADRTGIDQKYFSENDEKPADSLVSTLLLGTFKMNFGANPYESTVMRDKIFQMQADVIKEFADREDCIMIGRCAGYLLRDYPQVIRVFLSADMNFRAKRIMQSEGIGWDEAAKQIHRTDKDRENYFTHYTGEKWRDCGTYDLAIRTSEAGIDGAVDLIIDYAKLRFGEDIFNR